MRLSHSIVCIFVLTAPIAGSVQSQDMDTLWTQTYWTGGFDSANYIQETSDGGFVMVGYSQPFAVAESDIFLVKTDSDGNEEWSTLIGAGTYNTGFHVLQTYDDGYLISAISDEFGTGTGDFRLWIIKTDSNGDTVWTFPFTDYDYDLFPTCAVETCDSGFAITGRIAWSGSNDCFILRLDSAGNYSWFEHYDDDGHTQDGWFIAEMPVDSGFMISGHDDNYYTTGYDFWVLRTDKNGLALWDSSYAITGGYDGTQRACLVDDGLVMVGIASGVGHALKVDFDGHTVWSKEMSIAAFNEEYNCVCPSPDGGLMVGGWVWVTGHRRDFCFIKLDAELDTLWSLTVGGTEDDHGRSIVPTSDGGYALTGMSASFAGGYTCFYLVKVGETESGVVETTHGSLPSRLWLSQNYPNPFNPATEICFDLPRATGARLTVYDLLGHKVETLVDRYLKAGSYTVDWDASGLATGVYLYRLETDDCQVSKKMILLK